MGIPCFTQALSLAHRERRWGVGGGGSVIAIDYWGQIERTMPPHVQLYMRTSRASSPTSGQIKFGTEATERVCAGQEKAWRAGKPVCLQKTKKLHSSIVVEYLFT